MRPSRRLRVAVQGWLPMQEASGAKTRLLGLLNGLAQCAPDDVDVVLLAGPDTQDTFGRVVDSIPRASMIDCGIRSEPTWRRHLDERRRLPARLASHGIDVLDIASLPLPERPRDCAVVLTLHDLRDFGSFARGIRSRLVASSTRAALHAADRIVVPSPQVAKELALRFAGSARRIEVVPGTLPALTTAAIRPDASRPDASRVDATGEDSRGRTATFDGEQSSAELAPLLHIGRPEARKRIDFLLRAFARSRISDRKLVLIGGGDASAWRQLCELARGLGIAERVRMLGELDDNARNRELAKCHALAFPSLLEGFGLPALEAIAHGKPVLCVRGSAPHWIAGPGALALDEGEQAWAHALRRISHDAELTRRLGAAAQRRASDFAERRMAERWIAAWRAAADTRAKSACRRATTKTETDA